MAKPRIRQRLLDIIVAIDEAAEILDGADFAGYCGSVAKRRGIERCIEIISEASRHIPADACDRHPEIPWLEIRAIGNKLRHEYQRVDDLVIWRIANRSLSPLRSAVANLLASAQ